MSEDGMFELAIKITSDITQYCKSSKDSQKILVLVRELLNVRWTNQSQQS
jgi:hypothetical protein